MWSEEFDPVVREAHFIARLLVSTVAVPSPVPAVARILIGRAPTPPEPGIGLPSFEFYLKVVQFLTPTTILTRILDLEALRAVKEFRPAASPGQDRELGFIPPKELQEREDGIKKQLTPNNPVRELVLATDAVAYILESTVVLLRTEQWVGAPTAASSFPLPLVHHDLCARCPIPPGKSHLP
jgi:hypothetical protein